MSKSRVLSYLVCGGEIVPRAQNKRSEWLFYGGRFCIIIGILFKSETKKKRGEILSRSSAPLPKRLRYAQWSLLSVATYPTQLQR